MKKLLGLIALVLVAVSYLAGDMLGAVALATVPTSLGGVYDNQFFTKTLREYRDLLSMTIGKQLWWKSKLSQMISVIDYDSFKKTGALGSVKDSPKLPKEAIIHVIRDFKSKKGVIIDMPILVPVKGKGKTGTQKLKGTGIARKVLSSRCAINMKRQAIAVRDSEMSEQTIGLELGKKLMSKDGDDLRDWFDRWIGFEAWFSTFEGFSTNLTEATYGGGFSRASHPNFYVQGNGKATFANEFTSAYEDNVATALATLNTATAGDNFSAQSIKNMVFLAKKHKVQEISMGGKYAYVIFINSAQARNLRQDIEWVSYQKEAASKGQGNTLFTGALEGLLFEGAYIIVDDTIPSARIAGDTGFTVTGTATTSGTLVVGKVYYISAAGSGADFSAAGGSATPAVGEYFTATTTSIVTWGGATLLEDAVCAGATNGLVSGVQYGVTDYMDNPRDEGSRNLAVLFGQGAIHFAEGLGFKLTEEVDDHGQEIEIGGRMIYGATRPDIFDHNNMLGNGAGKFVENPSSIVYGTADTDDITI